MAETKIYDNYESALVKLNLIFFLQGKIETIKYYENYVIKEISALGIKDGAGDDCYIILDNPLKVLAVFNEIPDVSDLKPGLNYIYKNSENGLYYFAKLHANSDGSYNLESTRIVRPIEYKLSSDTRNTYYLSPGSDPYSFSDLLFKVSELERKLKTLETNYNNLTEKLNEFVSSPLEASIDETTGTLKI